MRHSEVACVSLFVELGLIAHVISTSASSWCTISAYSGTLIPDPHRTPTSSPCSEFVYMYSSSYSCKCVIRCP